MKCVEKDTISQNNDNYYISTNNTVYKIIYTLGRGSVGKVYLINKLIDMKESNENYIIKISNTRFLY
jgi:hypothetical protein